MNDLPFERIASRRSDSPVLFVCDHASNKLPVEYGGLGLSPELFETHIASDIGAADVTRTLAGEFGATAIMARWSRLLIDLNRGPDFLTAA
jgi:predicted N-formylglutamate amidohydrolase